MARRAAGDDRGKLAERLRRKADPAPPKRYQGSSARLGVTEVLQPQRPALH